jgi:hypothetical protein
VAAAAAWALGTRLSRTVSARDPAQSSLSLSAVPVALKLIKYEVGTYVSKLCLAALAEALESAVARLACAGAQPCGVASSCRSVGADGLRRGAHERPEPRRPAQLAATRHWRGRPSIPPCPAYGVERASEPWAARKCRCLPSMRRAQGCVPLARRCDPRAAIRCAAPYGCGLTQLSLAETT